MKTRDYCVYRYSLLKTGEVIYIGKTDASLKQRINAHEKEDKFQPYRGLWKIDYIELANNVETDIVEKYLINELKPVLNEKDCVQGLTSMVISLPNWQPYEKYVEKEKHRDNSALIKATKDAIVDDYLFQSVYNTILSEESTFETNRLHPTGLLSILNEKKRVTGLCVEKTETGYRQTVNPSIVAEIKKFPYQIQTKIWEPVALLFPFYPSDKDLLEKIDFYISFADTLQEFKKNGFQQDPDSERYILQIQNEEELISLYNSVFSNVKIYGNNAFLEINADAYNEIPIILEKLAKEKLVLYKSAGIIPYDEMN